MLHEDLTETIIGSAYNVFNELGHGFLESVYEKSLLVELQKSGIQYTCQEHLEVFYHGEPVGDFFADIIVDNRVIVELKSVKTLNTVHEVQLVNYLAATKIDVGLLINFSPKGVEIKRKSRLQK